MRILDFSDGFQSASSPTGVDISEFKVEEFILSAGDISAKEVTLSDTPQDATLTFILIDGGPSQHYTTDFTISGLTLSWNALGMDGILEENDRILVVYNT